MKKGRLFIMARRTYSLINRTFNLELLTSNLELFGTGAWERESKAASPAVVGKRCDGSRLPHILPLKRLG
jgi:hypothetical protein